MDMVLKATEVRNHFSEFIDNVIRDKPQFMKRNRDIVLSFSEDQIKRLLENYRFNVTFEQEEDGSYMALADGFDLIGAGETKDDAKYDLAGQLMEYAEEYHKEFNLYVNAPNRSHHFPYVLHILTKNDIHEVISLIDD